MLTNSRHGTRRLLHYPAKLYAGQDSPLRDCVLVDVSESGARLRVEEPDVLPAELTILLSSRGVPHRDCRIVWRSTEENRRSLHGACRR